MSRGHFAPNADFVYYAFQVGIFLTSIIVVLNSYYNYHFQDSTFYFINVAPQWQCFNGGNWNQHENGLRGFVERNQNDLTVYTGTHGVCELDDINGNKVEIKLHPEDDRLPVPR